MVSTTDDCPRMTSIECEQKFEEEGRDSLEFFSEKRRWFFVVVVCVVMEIAQKCHEFFEASLTFFVHFSTRGASHINIYKNIERCVDL